MRTRRRWAAIVAAAWWVSAGVAMAADRHPPGSVAARLMDIKWQDGPFPGSKSAVLVGDPKTGMHHVYLKFADGAFVPPHWHSTDEYVTVVQGMILFGTGEVADRDKTRLYAAGAFVYMPAGVRHFAWAKGETILSQTRSGPVDFNWVHPEDAPKAAPMTTTPAEKQ